MSIQQLRSVSETPTLIPTADTFVHIHADCYRDVELKGIGLSGWHIKNALPRQCTL